MKFDITRRRFIQGAAASTVLLALGGGIKYISALLSDIETSTANKIAGWLSSVHWATTKTDFETGEQFYVDSSISPGNVVLRTTKYFFACQGGGSSNAVYRFNESTLAWEAIASVPAGGSTTYVGAGGGLSYPGTGNYVYCLKGNTTAEFYRYDIRDNTWSAMTSVPVTVTTGGFIRAVQIGASYYLYVFTGGTGFYSYDIGAGTWSSALASPGTTGAGASMTWDMNNTIYATLGGGTTTFLSYSISGNTWTTLTSYPLPGAVGAGSEIAYVNTGTAYIYATRGNSTTDFYRYNIGTPGWSSMANTPGAIVAGSSLRWDGSGFLVALQGGDNGSGKTNFWRYNLLLNTWGTSVAPVAVGATNYPVTTGGAYTSGGSQYDYAFTGGATNYFLSYDKVNNTWALLTSPTNTSAGACMVYVGSNIYALEGGNSKNLWKYSGGSWAIDAQTPVAVTDGGCLEWGGGNDIYATFGNTKTFERYNTVTKSWTSLANKLGNTNNGGCLAWDRSNYIYATNGQGNGFERYSISGNTWATLANVPGNVNSGGSLAYPYSTYSASNPLFATRGGNTVSFYKYAPSTNTWSVMANVPSAVAAGGSLCDGEDGYIHCITGNNSTNHWRYTIAADTWTVTDTITPYPVVTGSGARMSASLSGYNTSGYMISEVIDNSGICEGGMLVYDGTNVYGTAGDQSTAFWQYNIGTNTWSSKKSILERTGWGASLCYDNSGNLYGFTGYGYGGNRKRVFLKYNIVADSWTELPDAPGDVWMGGTVVYIAGYVYAFTGGNTNFWRYDISADSWSSLDALSDTSINTGAGASMVYDGTYIYLSTGGASKSFRRYSVSGNTWDDRADVPDFVQAGGGLAYPGSGDYIYCLQGYDTANFYRYTISTNTWTQLSSTPMTVFQGGYLVAGDSGFLYTCRGRDTTNFWRYEISTGNWTSMNPTPTAAYIRLDALAWDRTLPADTTISYSMRSSATSFNLTDASPAWGSALTPDYSDAGTSAGTSAVLSGLGSNRYIQFKINFTTAFIDKSPMLSERRIYYYRWF